jgi:hypothetical protein
MPTDIVLVDRDSRRRPRGRWRQAWAESNHLGGTISTASHAHEAVERGDWRDVVIPSLGCLLMVSAFFGVAFVAAVLAGGADTSQRRGLFLILASVALSQALTWWQNQHPVKRLFVAAAERTYMPDGWGAVYVTVPAATAPRAKRALQSAFPYVEATYYRGGDDAELSAWFGPVPEGAVPPSLDRRAVEALHGFQHTVGNIVWHPA